MSIFDMLDTKAPERMGAALLPANIEQQRFARLIQAGQAEQQGQQLADQRTMRDLLATAGTMDPTRLSQMAMERGLYNPARQFAADAQQQQELALKQQRAQAEAMKAQREERSSLMRQALSNPSNEYLASIGVPPEELSTMPQAAHERRVYIAGKIGDPALIKQVQPVQKQFGEEVVTIDPWTGQELSRTGVKQKTPDWQNPAYQDFMMRKAAAGKTSLTVNTGTEKKFGEKLGGLVADEAINTIKVGQAAQSTLDNIASIRQALPFARMGPGANILNYADQLAETLGVAGKDTKERLQNSAAVLQSLAKEELNAAAAMRGQGQITENERGILRRASLGDITTYTPTQMKQLLDAVEKVQKEKIRQATFVRQKMATDPQNASMLNYLPSMQSVNRPAPFKSSTGAIIELED